MSLSPCEVTFHRSHFFLIHTVVKGQEETWNWNLHPGFSQCVRSSEVPEVRITCQLAEILMSTFSRQVSCEHFLPTYLSEHFPWDCSSRPGSQPCGRAERQPPLRAGSQRHSDASSWPVVLFVLRELGLPLYLPWMHCGFRKNIGHPSVLALPQYLLGRHEQGRKRWGEASCVQTLLRGWGRGVSQQRT